MSESTVVSKGPCDTCGSSDAKHLYDDGHTHCYACGEHLNDPDGMPASAPKRAAAGLLTGLQYQALPSRRITEETARKFGYGVTTYRGKPAQVAPYYDADGTPVAQKVRGPDKAFSVVGDLKAALPFGAHVWPKTGKMVVVTEGEVDALSMSQVQGNKYPVVSLINGATSAKKFFAQHRDYFLGFEKVVLMLDNDEPGKDAAKAGAEVLGSRAHIATLPLKDANDMLVAGRVEELVTAMWRAEPYRPEGIVDMASVKDAVLTQTPQGISTGFSGLDRITYGLRTGELWGIGAGAGAGKTDFLTQLIAHLVTTHKVKVGAFFLESTPAELTRRFAGKLAGKPFHVPDAGWTPEDLTGALDKIPADTVFLYDSFGVNEWAPVQAKIEYLYHAYGVQFFVLDHLTAFAANDPANERQVLEEVMGAMGSLVKRIPITIICVSHLATPEGKPHEEGGQVSLRHLKGARALGFWLHLAFGLERNQQAEDKTERFTTTVRCIKNRPFGHLNGEVFLLRYDPSTGLLNEVDEATDDLYTPDAPATPAGASDF